jgi:hypothetical protein
MMTTMVWAAVLFLGTIQDERIGEWIRQLDSDDPARRGEATTELVRIGKPGLPALRKAASESESAEVRARADQVIDAYMDSQLKNIYRERFPKHRLVRLGTKPLNCREAVERFFPGYRFYLVTLNEETPGAAGVLTPENEILDYELSQNHKDQETTLLRLVKAAGVTVRNREDARSFGLLWLLLAYGTEEFKVETTDHQDQVRY